MVKNQPAMKETRDSCSLPESGISPGEVNGYLLQYSCLGNPMDRGAWWATVRGVTKSRTRLSDFHYRGQSRSPERLSDLSKISQLQRIIKFEPRSSNFWGFPGGDSG